MNKMGFEDFATAVVDRIRDFLPQDYANANVELRTVTKNNDMRLTGLTIRSIESNIAPTIYLEQFYDRYSEGEAMSEILQKIADTRLRHEVNDTFCTEQITDFENVKDRIVPKLVNKAWNEELLKDRVHTDMGDLSVTYQILLQQDFSGNATVAITNQLMKGWDIQVSALHALALKNMSRLTPSTFEPMSKVLASMLGEEAEMFTGGNPEDEIMWVLTNSGKINGSAAVLDKEIMRTVADTLGDFIILPSSIHELILIRNTKDTDTEMLEQMIKEVNNGQVAQDERLSDHPYRYSIEEGLLPV